MSLLREFKRRNVFRVAAAYVIVGCLLIQIETSVLQGARRRGAGDTRPEGRFA